MKKIIFGVAALLLFASVNIFADDYRKQEATERIVRSVEEGRGVCRDANGNRGTYQTTGYTRTTTTSSSNSTSNSNGYSNSSSMSAGASAGISGIKPEASANASWGSSSSNNRSQSYGNSSTTTTSTTERVECVPFGR